MAIFRHTLSLRYSINRANIMLWILKPIESKIRSLAIYDCSVLRVKCWIHFSNFSRYSFFFFLRKKALGVYFILVWLFKVHENHPFALSVEFIYQVRKLSKHKIFVCKQNEHAKYNIQFRRNEKSSICNVIYTLSLWVFVWALAIFRPRYLKVNMQLSFYV